MGDLCSQPFRLHFTKFDLEYGNSRCPYDKLKVYDVYNKNSRIWRGTYCGSKRPSDIISKAKEMYVSFTTDGTVIKSGFAIHYSVGKTVSSKQDSGI